MENLADVRAARPEAFALEDRRRENEAFLTAWGAVFEYAQIAIRAIVLVNGAAATGILTFMGSGHSDPDSILMLGLAVCVFAVGVVAAVLACFFAYLNQYRTVRTALDCGGVVRVGASSFRIYAIIASFAGLGCFLAGISLATVAHWLS